VSPNTQITDVPAFSGLFCFFVFFLLKKIRTIARAGRLINAADYFHSHNLTSALTKLPTMIKNFGIPKSRTFQSLSNFLSSDTSADTSANNFPAEENVLLESLKWIESCLEFCPEEVLPFVPRILEHLLPAVASYDETIRHAASRVNTALMEFTVSLEDGKVFAVSADSSVFIPSKIPSLFQKDASSKEILTKDRRESNNRASLSGSRELESKRSEDIQTPPPAYQVSAAPTPSQQAADLDYGAAVESLTLLFLNDQEATRVGALTWLLMLHRKAPKKVLAFNDGTFPVLLKTLSDPADTVVRLDLQLLSQISKNSEDEYFASFMIHLLQLFSTDRKLLETRGNLIIRQLCVNLSAERIYRILADCLEKEEDVEFASIMVQNLNNNLITAPELAELRKRLRNLETKVSCASFFEYTSCH